MRQLLLKLKCSDYLTLVAASSIIRPGVASSGMMRAYIERYHDPENIDYIHPVMNVYTDDGNPSYRSMVTPLRGTNKWKSFLCFMKI